MSEVKSKPNSLRPRNILALLLTIATLAPIVSFISNISTPFIKRLLMIGPEQSFTLCDVQSFCESSNQRFESFLQKYFNEKVTLDIIYDISATPWDPCWEDTRQADPHEQICDEFRESDYISYTDCLELTPSDLRERAIPQGIVERLAALWASETEESPFLDIPLFGNGQCRTGAIARFDSELAIFNASPGTGLATYRVFGDYLVGGKTGLYFLTHIN